MRIKYLSVQNYRSIKEIKDIPFNNIQALVGENNSGKSNVLSAIECFLTSGAGARVEDFNDESRSIIIKITFDCLEGNSKKAWRPYLINDELILEKQIWIETNDRGGKASVRAEFHGYKAEPEEWFYSLEKIQEKEGNRPDWAKIVQEENLPSYFLDNNGKCNKALYRKGLERFLSENEVQYDMPDISETQALGLSAVAVSNLPRFYLLKAVTDYSNEIDRRSSSTTFRRLMADLSDRILKKDENYNKINKALNTITALLNEMEEEHEDEDGKIERLGAMAVVEEKIKSLLSNLIPGVERVRLKVLMEDIQSIFSRGVELSIDDGVETDVLMKGHGLQRCVVFTLLQTLIFNERNQLVEGEAPNEFPLILAIEEPELYIHPQIRKLFYDVLIDFSQTDQVLYTTHSTHFIDVHEYHNISLVQKCPLNGTRIQCSDNSAFEGLLEDERKMFKGLARFNSEINELFFARNVLLVEGPEDKMAVTETLRKQEKIKYRTEEINISIVVAGGKPAMPFIIRVLNSFRINYVVLCDSDIETGMNPNAKAVKEKENQAIAELTKSGKIVIFPFKLEATVGKPSHFKDQYEAFQFFSDFNNINAELKGIVNSVVEKF